MSVKLELISSAAAYRDIENRVGTQPVDKKFYKSVNNVVRWEDDDLLCDLYKIVSNIDKNIKNRRITKIEGAETRRKIFMKMIRSRMIRFNRLSPDILRNEGIDMNELGIDFAHQYHSTDFIIEAIQKYPAIQNQITLLAKNGKQMSLLPSSETLETKKKVDQVTSKSGKNLFRRYVNTREEQILEDNLLQNKENDVLNGCRYSIEDICYSIVNGSGQIPNVIELGIVPEILLRGRIWRLSPTALRKLIEMIVKTYKVEFKDTISQYRNAKCKVRKLNWSQVKNKKVLSAQDKRKGVKEGKANGLKQKEVATQIGCSVRIVQKYWNMNDL